MHQFVKIKEHGPTIEYIHSIRTTLYAHSQELGVSTSIWSTLLLAHLTCIILHHEGRDWDSILMS